jgi:hypothetical protein
MFERHLTDLSVSEFLQAIASAAQPVPAGGSGAALSGAASAALLVLVCDVLERHGPDVLTQPRQKAAELQQKHTSQHSQAAGIPVNSRRMARSVSVDEIIRTVSLLAGIDESALKSRTWRRPLKQARIAAAHLLLVHCGLRRVEIGQQIGRSDQTVSELTARAKRSLDGRGRRAPPAIH